MAEKKPVNKIFDENIKNAFQSFIRDDKEKARMQLGSIETNLKRRVIESPDSDTLNKINRVRMIYSGLFGKKFKGR